MQPNILLILTDDQGVGDLSRTGNRMLSTPHIDRLAADGAILSHFFVQPVCAPTRAELLTGRLYPFTGVSGVQHGAERVNPDETFLPELLKDAGYATGCFGKWHSGAQYPYHPCARGFEEFLGFCCGHWSHYFDSTLEHNGEEFQSEGYLPDVLTDHAISFMKENREKPFFCYVPLNTPHAPWQVPDAYFEKFDGMEICQTATDPAREVPDKTRCALAMCENIDWNVGRMVETLKELGLYEDTIVIYFSDNGPNSHRWNAGLRGIKGSTLEGGVRSPCSITYPSAIPAGQEWTFPTAAIDLLPTLCGLCGVKPATTHPVHGKDLSDLLTSGDPLPDRTLFAVHHQRKSFSARRGDFRYHDSGVLYDIANDPGETRDVASEHPGLCAELKRETDTMVAAMPAVKEHHTIPVGYPEWPVTHLETQDAITSGSIQRSSIHPNCSWICGWTDLNDDLTWQIEVETAGTYALTLLYSAHAGMLGSRFEAECGGSTCAFGIVEEGGSQNRGGDAASEGSEVDAEADVAGVGSAGGWK